MNERLLKPALIGGVLLGILSSLPVVNCVCCAWAIAGGVLAAYLYVKDSPELVTLGRGVGLGLFTGFVGAIVTALFSIPLFFLTRAPGTGFMDQMRKSIEQIPNLPPDTRQALESVYSQGGMGIVIYAIGFIFMLVFFSLLGMLGGAIGVAIFEKRKPGSPYPDVQPPYEPPPPSIPPPPPPTDAS